METESRPAAWYVAPDSHALYRFWDGTEWTDRYQQRPAPPSLPMPKAVELERCILAQELWFSVEYGHLVQVNTNELRVFGEAETAQVVAVLVDLAADYLVFRSLAKQGTSGWTWPKERRRFQELEDHCKIRRRPIENGVVFELLDRSLENEHQLALKNEALRQYSYLVNRALEDQQWRLFDLLNPTQTALGVAEFAKNSGEGILKSS